MIQKLGSVSEPELTFKVFFDIFADVSKSPLKIANIITVSKFTTYCKRLELQQGQQYTDDINGVHDCQTQTQTSEDLHKDLDI